MLTRKGMQKVASQALRQARGDGVSCCDEGTVLPSGHRRLVWRETVSDPVPGYFPPPLLSQKYEGCRQPQPVPLKPPQRNKRVATTVTPRPPDPALLFIVEREH